MAGTLLEEDIKYQEYDTIRGPLRDTQSNIQILTSVYHRLLNLKFNLHFRALFFTCSSRQGMCCHLF